MKMMIVGTGSMKSPMTVKRATISNIIRCGSLPARPVIQSAMTIAPRKICKEPPESIGCPDRDERERENQTRKAEIISEKSDMDSVQRGKYDKKNVDNCDHTGLGWSEPPGQNASQKDDRDHQRQ